MTRVAPLLALLITACTTRPATQIIVEVDAESGVRADLDVVHVVVNGGDGTTVGAPSIQRLDVRERPPRWPFTVVIAPLDRDPERRYEVVVTAEGAQPGMGARPLVARVRAISGFVPGETRILRLLLEDACRGVLDCEPDETCRSGACGPATVDARALPRGETDAGVELTDVPSLDVGGEQDSDTDAGRSSLAPREEAMLLAPDGRSFGWSVSLNADGSRALVGAVYDDTAAGMQSGSARVFVRSGTNWTEEATLLAAGGAPDDEFGVSVSLSADGVRALVGAERDDTPGGVDAGSARVFVRSGTSWTEEATLLASGGTLANYFGGSVSLSADGSRALVGGHNTTPGGAARVFVRSGTSWTEEAALLATGTGTFGVSVALSADGSRALVGASQDEPGGSARVFVRSGRSWVEEARLVALGGVAGDRFGVSVSLSVDGSRALIGANGTPGGANTGSAHVFVRGGTRWTEETALLAAGGAPDDRFGGSVSLSADGARSLVAGWSAAGTEARFFVRSGATWIEEATLTVGDSVSISADGSRALVGAPYEGMSAGSARVFTLE